MHGNTPRLFSASPGWPSWTAASRSGLGLCWCWKMDGTDSLLVPEPFGFVLDDRADPGNLDAAFRLPRTESPDDGCDGLVRWDTTASGLR
jgi:hypothetical protein